MICEEDVRNCRSGSGWALRWLVRPDVPGLWAQCPVGTYENQPVSKGNSKSMSLNKLKNKIKICVDWIKRKFKLEIFVCLYKRKLWHQ